MNSQPRIPDPETRARSVTKLHDICTIFDAQIMVLDKLITQIEAENRKSSLYTYRLKRAKRLLESPKQEMLEKVGE